MQICLVIDIQICFANFVSYSWLLNKHLHSLQQQYILIQLFKNDVIAIGFVNEFNVLFAFILCKTYTIYKFIPYFSHVFYLIYN